jgi:hypothetical protein
MSANTDQNAMMGGKLSESLLQVNQLSYRLPPQLSIASKVTHVIDYAQQSSYSSGETVLFDCQTGTQFIDPKESYLLLKIDPNKVGGSFGSGSVLNIFERIVVRTKTGKELSRVESANLLNRVMDRYNKPQTWLDTLGKNQGYSTYVSGTQYADEIPDAGKYYTIPIQSILPCMNPVGAKLVPPNLMSGLRIELTLARPQDAMVAVNTTVGLTAYDYDVVKPEIHWKTYTLADQFARKIQEMSNSGLSYLYKEYFHTIISTAQQQINFDVKKACSKCLKAVVLTRNTADVNNTDWKADKMASAEFKYTRYQSHISSDYMPNQPLQLDSVSINDISQSYYYNLYALDKLDSWNPPSVTPAQYKGSAGVYPCGVVSFNFNKSNVSDLQGYTISNSRSLLVDMTQDAGNDVRLDVYLCFLRLAKVMQSNCLVLD